MPSQYGADEAHEGTNEMHATNRMLGYIEITAQKHRGDLYDVPDLLPQLAPNPHSHDPKCMGLKIPMESYATDFFRRNQEIKRMYMTRIQGPPLKPRDFGRWKTTLRYLAETDSAALLSNVPGWKDVTDCIRDELEVAREKGHHRKEALLNEIFEYMTDKGVAGYIAGNLYVVRDNVPREVRDEEDLRMATQVVRQYVRENYRRYRPVRIPLFQALTCNPYAFPIQEAYAQFTMQLERTQEPGGPVSPSQNPKRPDGRKR